MTSSSKYIRIWLYSGIVLVAAMVMVGGITRLTGSGLSIVEWKPVTGTIPPLSDADWQLEFEKYKQFPEFQKLNYNMSLSEFKQIFFWEYLHRLLGRLIGIVFLIPFTVFYYKGWINKKLAAPLIFIFLMGGLQGAVGWYMVKSGLNNLPHVSHFRLALHQGMALTLLAAIYWTVISLDKQRRTKSLSSKFFKLSIIALMLLAAQVTWGAFVAGLKAGYSYNNFPFMGDSFFPSSDLVKIEPYFYNGVLLQFTHRWLAFLVLGAFTVLFFVSKPFQEIHKQTKQLLVIASVQVLLGVITLMLSVPIILGVLHQFVAIFVIMAMIKVVHVQLFERAGDAK
jgi:cytochrome c oxidase assembly protein subunit 15